MATSRTRDIAIDPNFPVPPVVVDVRQLNREEAEEYYEDTTYAEEGEISYDEDSTIPMAPSTFNIIEQRVRIANGGRAVVDVTLEFPDDEGISSIDVRVTKI